MKWVKRDNYHATNGNFTMSWYAAQIKGSVESIFMLYKNNDCLVVGSKKECLDKFKESKR